MTREAPAPDEVKFDYLGVGGWLVRYGGESILMAPSFTNPGVWLLPFPVASDEERVKKYLGRIPDLSGVKVVLVGHAHYDHLLDLESVLKHTPNATVYGSTTVLHTLGRRVSNPTVDAEQFMARGDRPGQWLPSPSPRIRVMAIESEHAPHGFGLKFLRGHYAQDVPQEPPTIFDWREGQTLAYLVDFLDEHGQPVFRLHYQDAASRPRLGFIPKLDEPKPKRVDAAILCVASFSEVKHYPECAMRSMQPRYALLGHWEDFFGNDPDQPKGVRLTKVPKFVELLKPAVPPDGKWVLPAPLSEVRVPLDPGSEAQVQDLCPPDETMDASLEREAVHRRDRMDLRW